MTSSSGPIAGLRRRLTCGLLIALVTVSVAACSASSSSSSSSSTGSTSSVAAKGATTSGSLSVWVDSSRIPAVTAYEKAHPKVHVHMTVYDGDANGSGTLQTKMELFNRAGSGWPDVVFSTQDNDAASLSDSQIHYAAALNGSVPASVVANFAHGSLGFCQIGGKLYCLRNDYAPNVLWYNAKLMKQFGYQVPTTWQQWQAIGMKVATQHPGYIIGTSGDSYGEDIYYWGNRCPINQLSSAGTTVTINGSAQQCTEMSKLLDPLIANKTVPPSFVLTSGFVKKYQDKVLMLIGPLWYGEYVFEAATSLHTPKGVMAAAAPLRWAGGPATTGDVGGGLWMMSSHAKDVALAASFVQWVSTATAYQGDLAPGYPAYAPAARVWLKQLDDSHYLAKSPNAVFAQAADAVWTGWSPVRYATDSIWNSTVVPALVAGHSLTDVFPDYASKLADYARSQQYQVAK